MRIYNNPTELIGSTPLVRMNRVPQAEGVVADIVCKLEYLNPGLSVKDRIGVSMIDDAEKRGLITPGKTLNYRSYLGQYGNRSRFYLRGQGLPSHSLHAGDDEHGAPPAPARLRRGDRADGRTEGHEGRGRRRRGDQAARDPENSFIPQQFNNPANPDVHRRTTAEEIWNDTDGTVDMLVAGVGTGGTITGI